MSTKKPEQCLCCQQPKLLYARGICSSCYQKWRRVMKMIPAHRRDEAEQKLVSEGKLLAAEPGPRGDSNPFLRDLAEFLTDSERAALAEAAAIEDEHPGTAKPPVPAKGGRKPKPPGSQRRG
jgi:hypothetical protein